MLFHIRNQFFQPFGDCFDKFLVFCNFCNLLILKIFQRQIFLHYSPQFIVYLCLIRRGVGLFGSVFEVIQYVCIKVRRDLDLATPQVGRAGFCLETAARETFHSGHLGVNSAQGLCFSFLNRFQHKFVAFFCSLCEHL